MKTKTMTLLMILLLSPSLRASETITCDNGACDVAPALTVTNQSEEVNQSQVELSGVNVPLVIEVPNNESPRDLYLNIDSNDSQDLTFNMSSTKLNNNAGSFIVFANAVDNVQAILNGKTGLGADNLSKACADEILNDNLGPAVKAQYLQARVNNPNLPSNECVASDLMTISSNQFECPAGFNENNGNMTVTRWTKRRRCRGMSERKMCVARKMKLSCKWLAQSWDSGCGQSYQKPSNPSGVNRNWVYEADKCVPGQYSGWVYDPGEIIVDEDYVLSRRFLGKSDSDICEDATGRLPSQLNTHIANGFHGSGRGSNKGGSSSYSVIPGTFDSDGNITVKQINDYGGFSGSKKTEHFNVYMPPGLKNIGGFEYAAGQACWYRYSSNLSGCINRNNYTYNWQSGWSGTWTLGPYSFFNGGVTNGTYDFLGKQNSTQFGVAFHMLSCKNPTDCGIIEMNDDAFADEEVARDINCKYNDEWCWDSPPTRKFYKYTSFTFIMRFNAFTPQGKIIKYTIERFVGHR